MRGRPILLKLLKFLQNYRWIEIGLTFQIAHAFKTVYRIGNSKYTITFSLSRFNATTVNIQSSPVCNIAIAINNFFCLYFFFTTIIFLFRYIYCSGFLWYMCTFIPKFYRHLLIVFAILRRSVNSFFRLEFFNCG